DETLAEDLGCVSASAVRGKDAVTDVPTFAFEEGVRDRVADRRAPDDHALHLGNQERGGDVVSREFRADAPRGQPVEVFRPRHARRVPKPEREPVGHHRPVRRVELVLVVETRRPQSKLHARVFNANVVLVAERGAGKLSTRVEEVRMARTAVGWRSHSGWAVFVAVRGPAAFPQVLARRRIELVNDSLPRQPYHAIAEQGLSLRAVEALIARVEKVALDAAVASTESVRDECGIDAVGVVGRVRVVPDELE